MAKASAKRRLEAKADREVTVSLRGWPKEVKQFSVVDEYWYVELAVAAKDRPTFIHTVFEADNYPAALAKYTAFAQMVKG